MFVIFKHPYGFFTEIFAENLIDLLCRKQSGSVKMNPGKTQEFTKDIRKYIGICIVMTYIHLPSCRDYWRPTFGKKLFQKFFWKIRKYIHFTNIEDVVPKKEARHDHLFKIRPVVEECLSIDKQICPPKARRCLKQYIPSKPHKCGYKLFVICGVSGYSYHF
jgi:hypothetical protein